MGSYIIRPATYRDFYNPYQQDITFGFIQLNLTDPSQQTGLNITPYVNHTIREKENVFRNCYIRTVCLDGLIKNCYRSLWSRPIPLAWYFAPQWERAYGAKWPQRLCDRWIMNDRYLKNFAAEVSLCPCTLKHALSDKGRFLPDYDCDKDSNLDCMYNQHAHHCVSTGAPK